MTEQHEWSVMAGTITRYYCELVPFEKPASETWTIYMKQS